MIIYQAINLINGHSYIGMTIQSLDKRIKQHLSTVKNRRRKFHNALIYYGSVNFKWEIIALALSSIELKKLEIKYIAELKPEYNLTIGGDGNVNPTLETRKKISDFMTGRPSVNRGRKFKQSNETKLKKSIFWKEKYKEDGFREKKSKSLLGKNKGKVCSEEQKIQISNTLKGNIPWNKGIKTGPRN